jgi:hypothetical protein
LQAVAGMVVNLLLLSSSSSSSSSSAIELSLGDSSHYTSTEKIIINIHKLNNTKNTVNTSTHIKNTTHIHTPTHYTTSQNKHSTRYTTNELGTIKSSTLNIMSP